MGFGHSDSTLAISEQSSRIAPSIGKPDTQNPSRRARSEEDDVPIEGAAAAPDLSLERGIEGGSTNLQRLRSCGTGYGRATRNDDEETTKDAEKGQDLNEQFEVRFDGDSDPMNPRSLSKTRKWVIVVIVSAGSTCECTFRSKVSPIEPLRFKPATHFSRAVGGFQS